VIRRTAAAADRRADNRPGEAVPPRRDQNGDRRATIRRGPCARRAAFTLVEVLVVVAVVALLLAMLGPALGRSKDLAAFAACKSRLHRAGLGVMQYAQANRGLLIQTPTLQNPLVEAVRAYHLDHPYVQAPEDLYCPSLTAPELACEPDNLRAGQIGYFYYCAKQYPADSSISTFLRHQVPWPRQLATWEQPHRWVFSDIFRSGVPTAHSMFKKGVNYLMLSGEVSSTTESPRESFH